MVLMLYATWNRKTLGPVVKHVTYTLFSNYKQNVSLQLS